MDGTAIKEILEHHAGIEALRCLAKAPSALVIPKDYKLQDIEQYLDNPTRLRGSYKTNNIDFFASYICKHSTPLSICFINPQKMQAVAIIDFGNEDNPLHREHKAVLTLEATPEFQALKAIDKKPMTQREAAEWCEDYLPNLNFLVSQSDDLETIPANRAISAIRQITVEYLNSRDNNVQNLSETRSTLESIEAKSKHTLPTELFFVCVPFFGLASHGFKLRIGISTDSPKPTLKFSICKLPEKLDEIAKEFEANLHETLAGQGAEIETYIGEFS